MLSSSTLLHHGFSPKSRQSFVVKRTLERGARSRVRREASVSPRACTGSGHGRMYSTATKATVEGTKRFFSPERQAKRLENMKARLEAKAALATGEKEANSDAPVVIDPKTPYIKPKVNRKTGWTMGPIGFGTYRLVAESMAHQESLELALQTGATNVIDCGPNYGKDSESLVGLTLQRLMDSGRVERGELIVVDKIGPLLKGSTLDPVKARAARGRPFQNMTFLSPDLGYCLDPDYIDFQITRSLKALDLDCIDLMLIDTPELILPEKPSENVLGQLYRLLQNTMGYLEQEVKRGRIQYYGIASSMLTALHRAAEPRLSLDMLFRTAHTLGEQNHFAAISYPMNVIEPQCAHNDVVASTQKDPNASRIWSQQGRDSSVQLMAFDAGLIQLASRPLNALIETKDIFTHLPQEPTALHPNGLLYRFADVPTHDGAKLAPLAKATINGCVALEKTYALEYAKRVAAAQGGTTTPESAAEAQANPTKIPQMPASRNPDEANALDMPHPKEFLWAQIIIANISRLDLATFKNAWQNQMKPAIIASVEALKKARPEMEYWAANYQKGMETLGEQYTQVLEVNRLQEIDTLTNQLTSACPALSENPTIASKAVRIVGSTLVTTTLVGMRNEKSVYDIVYGGGTVQDPRPMTPIDPSLLGNIFDAGSRHRETIRSAIKSQLALEDETSVNARRQAAEDRILGDALLPRDMPTPSSPQPPKGSQL